MFKKTLISDKVSEYIFCFPSKLQIFLSTIS